MDRELLSLSLSLSPTIYSFTVHIFAYILTRSPYSEVMATIGHTNNQTNQTMEGIPADVPLPSSEQFYMKSAHDDLYLVQISWPLSWKNGRFFEGSAPIM